MNNEKSEILATKTLMVLFEKNGTDAQMENVKALLNLFINEKKLQHEDIVLTKVLENAVLLKSVKIMEKGFPLLYFIQSKKFLGFHEVSSSVAKVNEYLVGRNNKEAAVEGLKSFFRGCEFIDNPNLVEAMRVINTSERKEEKQNTLDVGMGSKLIESTVWSVKWGVDSAWNLVASYAGYQNPEEKKLAIEDETAKIDETMESEDDFVDVVVLRSNWYGRTQKRVYRFHNDYFERVDPEGSKTGGEVVKAAYKYSDVAKITIENSADLVIHFRDPRLSTQWIHTPHDSNNIISLLCTRAPWTATIIVVRNLEMKMNNHNVHTAQFKLPSKVIGYPRWSKDGLFLAYQDEIGWKSIDLERLDLHIDEWWTQDLVHFPDQYQKNTIVSPLGNAVNVITKVMTVEDLEKEFYDYTSTTISYLDGKGLRTQHGGLVAETIDVIGNNSFLFVAKGTEFNGQWKLQHQKLRLLDRKCGVPLLSPDGKFVAFVEDATQTLIIHKVDFLNQSDFLRYQSNNLDLEEVLFDVRKQASKLKKTPSKIPPLPAEQQSTPDKPESAPQSLGIKKGEMIAN